MSFQMTWTLPASAEYVSICRNVLKCYLLEQGALRDDIDNLQVILGEACANVIRHAHINPDANYEVRFEHYLNSVALDIVDEGMGFDPDSPLRCDTDEGCGVGLILIRELSARTQIKSTIGHGASIHVEYLLSAA